VNLSRDHEPVVVYVAPAKQFRTIKTLTVPEIYARKAIWAAWNESSASCI
jgi:hypothetical protein